MSSQNPVDRLESQTSATQERSWVRRLSRQLRTRRRLLVAGLLVVTVSVVANGLLFLVAAALGAFPNDVLDPGSGQPFSLLTVAFASAVGAAGATAVYAVFRRYVANADRWFRRVAGAVLLASFATPFSIPDAPLATLLTLFVMHVVVAGVSVGFLTSSGGVSVIHD